MSGPTLGQIQSVQKMSPGTIGGESKAAQPITYEISHDDAVRRQWVRHIDMPTPRTAAGGAVMAGWFYVVGGATAVPTPASAVVESYQGGVWRSEPSLPSARTLPGVESIGTKIYAIGGDDGASSTDTLIFNGAAWSSGTSTPAAIPAPNTAVLNNQIHVVNTGKHWVYDPPTNSWATRTAPGGSIVGAVTAGGILYSFTNAGVLRAYNPATDTWAARTTSPLTTALAPEFGVYDPLSFIEIYGDTAARYSIGGNTWSTFAPPPTPRFLMAVASASGTIHTAGGNDAFSVVSGVYETYG